MVSTASVEHSTNCTVQNCYICKPPLHYEYRNYAPRPLSIQEQLGTDPVSRLAAAIERLAEALEGVRD